MLASGEARSDETFTGLRQDGVEIISAEFYDCRFVDCSFVAATFRVSHFVNCEFADCDLSLMELPGSRIRGSRFTRCKLAGVDWTRAHWSTMELEPSLEFDECSLNHSTFIGLNLPGLKMIDCIAREVDLRECALQEAVFDGTDLRAGLFGGTDLSRADLTGARNYSINVGRNKVEGTKFSLPEAMSLLYSMDIVLEEE